MGMFLHSCTHVSFWRFRFLSGCVCFLRFLALTVGPMLSTSVCQAWKTLTTAPFLTETSRFDLQF